MASPIPGELNLVGSLQNDEYNYLSGNDSGLDTGESDNESVFSTDLALGRAASDADTDATSDESGDDSDGDSGDDWEDDSDVDSDFTWGSSVHYHAEPFNAFETRVLALAQTVLWPGAAAEDLLIEKIRSYGHYRLTSITHRGTQEQRLLRVPWNGCQSIHYTLAAIHLVKQYTQISTPDLLTVDTTDNNPLASPYFVHTPPRGTLLAEMFDGLDHQDRCEVARKLGDMYRQMLDVHSCVAGKPVFGPNRSEVLVVPSSSMSPGPYNADYEAFETDFPTDRSAAAATGLHAPYTPRRGDHDHQSESARELLRFLIDKWIAAYSAIDEDGTSTHWRIAHNETLKAMVLGLGDLGFVDDDMPICLRMNHSPLTLHIDQEEPDTSSSTSSSGLSGPRITLATARDWDAADLVPAFAACYPPWWLWEWDDEDCYWDPTALPIDEEMKKCKDSRNPPEPGKEKAREIQEAFNEAAGPIYMRFAYDPLYVLARRLWFLTFGYFPREIAEEEFQMLAELWEQLKKEKEGKSLELMGTSATGSSPGATSMRLQPLQLALNCTIIFFFMVIGSVIFWKALYSASA
jgi:hypothetical protein